MVADRGGIYLADALGCWARRWRRTRAPTAPTHCRVCVTNRISPCCWHIYVHCTSFLRHLRAAEHTITHSRIETIHGWRNQFIAWRTIRHSQYIYIYKFSSAPNPIYARDCVSPSDICKCWVNVKRRLESLADDCIWWWVNAARIYDHRDAGASATLLVAFLWLHLGSRANRDCVVAYKTCILPDKKRCTSLSLYKRS